MKQLPNHKSNSIFRWGPKTYLNACVGKNGGPYGFDDYSLGYFESGKALIDAAIARDVTIDLVVYPIIYNYRHAIELGLKHLAEVLPPLWNDKKVSYKPTHKLIDVWKLLVPYLKRDTVFDKNGAIDIVDKVLKEIVQFDSDAEVFRFPANKGGKYYLQDSAHINLLVFGNIMEEVREIFEHWFGRANDIFDAQNQ
jgi:hypothetical protein